MPGGARSPRRNLKPPCLSVSLVCCWFRSYCCWLQPTTERVAIVPKWSYWQDYDQTWRNVISGIEQEFVRTRTLGPL